MADKTYDAIVVGSGATGGWAAKELCEAGLEVCMLEAGRALNPEEDFSEHVRPWERENRGRKALSQFRERQGIQSKTYAFSELNAQMFVDDVDNPYTTPKRKPFWWIRGRHVGGRTIMWGRQSYRLSPKDFKAASHDGYGEDWPVTYEEIAPYYDKVERFIGISGQNEGFEMLPDGQFLPAMPYRCGEVKMKSAAEKMGIGFTMGRTAVLTKNHRGRRACHYCGPCERGCMTGSYFSTPVSTLPAAERTGKLTLVTNAVVRHVTTNDENLADGVFYYDRHDKTEHRVRGKVVILCASTLESTRILFNSANDDFAGGLANSSGALGHYLMDHLYAVSVFGTMPGNKHRPEHTNRPNNIYIPRFRNVNKGNEQDYLRGFGYQGGEGVTVYEHAYATKGFGADFKQEVRQTNAARVSLAGFGEMLPRFENSALIDPDTQDAWGIPALHIDCAIGDNERAMAKDIVDTGKQILEDAGAVDIGQNSTPAPPGFGIHEMGTARMGADPKKSVLNKWNQTHDIPNLFVTDGAAFPSIGCQNPTLTMMALTARACEYIVEESKRGNLRTA